MFFYAVMFLFCLTDIKNLWIMAAVFLAIIALNVYFYIKHKNDKPSPIETTIIKAKENKKQSVREKKLKKRIWKQYYEEFLDELDREFDYDDELGDDE